MSCSRRQKSPGSPRPKLSCALLLGERSPLWVNLRRRKRLRYRPGGEGKGGKAPRHAGGAGWGERGSAEPPTPSRLQADAQTRPNPPPRGVLFWGGGMPLFSACAPSLGLGPAPGRARGQSRGSRVLPPERSCRRVGGWERSQSPPRRSGPTTGPEAPAVASGIRAAAPGAHFHSGE